MTMKQRKPSVLPSSTLDIQPDNTVNAMQQQLIALAAQVNRLTELVTSGKVSQAALMADANARHMTVLPSNLPNDAQIPDSEDFREEYYYVRIKPYDAQKGHVRRRQYFDEIGRAIDGGTGQPGDIPEWVKVTQGQAMALSVYRQNDDNQNSPAVLDIVTEEERERVDHAESQLRAATLGLAGMSPQAILQAAQRSGQINAQVASQGSKAKRSKPSIIQGADAYSPNEQPIANATAVAQKVPSSKNAGRMAALSNMPAPPAPSRGVSEDLTREAQHDADAAAALKAAEKYSNT